MFIFSFVCFVCLFLYGIEILSNYLEQRFNSQSLSILNNSSNIYISFLIGIIITFITQSSSAVTAIIIAFLNADKIKLKNAISIMMGSNIGTTFSSVFTCFNIDQYSYIILSLGLIMYFFKKTKNFSKLLLGIGFIFFSLFYLKNELTLVFSKLNYLNYFKYSNNSILLSTWNGILISGIIQSSSATISLTQIAVQDKLISLLSGICIVLGANIGTTFTGLIASIKSNKNAKTLAIANLLLNLFGVLLILPFVSLLSKTSYSNLSLYLSFIHILFNVGSCVGGLLLINPIINLSFKCIKKDLI